MDTGTAVPPSPRRRTAALAALALSAFVVGTSELVVVGLLPLIARDVHVSIAGSGQLVTAYALGIAIGGPILSALTTRLNRRRLLLLTVTAYIAGNALTAASADMTMVLVVRVATGAVHGLFIGVASIVAAGLVPPEQRGRAMSMVFGGIAVSTVVGVPLGTLLGQALGWRAAFLAIAALGTAALACAAALVPAVAGGGMAGLAIQ
ncbi:MAG: MFS transporter, partial [Actinobacteria bacterium]|nr:MFS transporter [Actinomycetota bacterium]